MDILGIIPARGGSKSLRKKNIRKLAGKPLIYYTIKEAKKSKFITKLVVSTENLEISKIVKKYKIEVINRPKNLASDNIPAISVISNTLTQLNQSQAYNPDIIVLLQPTSPLRTTKNIDEAIKLFLKGDRDSIISVCKIKHPLEWIYKISNKGKLEKFLKKNNEIFRRQDSPELYELNGAVYVFDKNKFLKTKKIIEKNSKPYIMPIELSVDIDNKFDFTMAELILKNRLIKNISY